MASRTHNLTFGIELEFLVAVVMNPDTFKDYMNIPITRRNIKAIKLFQEAVEPHIPSLHAISHETKHPDVYDRWHVVPDPSIQPGISTPQEIVQKLYPDKALLDYNFTRDLIIPSELVATDDGGAVLLGDVELTSPILQLSSQSWEREIAHVLSVIQGNHSVFRAISNQTCGLHVHVGLQGSFDDQLEQAKKVAAITTILEPVIDQFHSKERCENRFCHSMRKNSSFGGLEDDDVFDRIAEVGDLKILGELVNLDQKYHKVNFMGPSTTGLNTIEFRQHEGTLDFAAIKYWVLLVTGLVNAALNHSMSELREFLLEGEHTIEKLFRFIGDSRVKEYYTLR